MNYQCGFNTTTVYRAKSSLQLQSYFDYRTNMMFYDAKWGKKSLKTYKMFTLQI